MFLYNICCLISKESSVKCNNQSTATLRKADGVETLQLKINNTYKIYRLRTKHHQRLKTVNRNMPNIKKRDAANVGASLSSIHSYTYSICMLSQAKFSWTTALARRAVSSESSKSLLVEVTQTLNCKMTEIMVKISKWDDSDHVGSKDAVYYLLNQLVLRCFFCMQVTSWLADHF